jgi:hypothetical protein
LDMKVKGRQPEKQRYQGEGIKKGRGSWVVSRITVYCIHILTNHRETHYSVKFCALIKNICFKIEKYLPLKCPGVTYGETNDSAVVTRIKSEYAQGIRMSEFLSDSLWDSHWIQDRGNLTSGKINRDVSKFLSPLKV